MRFLYHRKNVEDEAIRDGPQSDEVVYTNHNKLKIFTAKVVGDFNRRDVFNPEQFRGLLATSQADKAKTQGNDEFDCIYNEEQIHDTKTHVYAALPDINVSKETTVDEALFRLQIQLGVILNLDEHEEFTKVDEETKKREQCGNCTIA